MTVLTLPVTVRALRAELATRFVAAGVESPNAEARDLIAVVVDKPRFWPVDHGNDVLADDVVLSARSAAERRAMGMPFAYAVGQAAFRQLNLFVDQRVLIPRQETELLVDLVLDATQGRGVVADIGTGSGCIALALATEGSYERVIATEISQESQTVARINAAAFRPALRSPVDIRGGDLLTPLSADDGVTAIVSNPPYIADAEFSELPPSVRDWEPHLALFSADGGLAITHQIIEGGAALLPSGGVLALEVDSRRAQRVADYARSSGEFGSVVVHRDFSDRERYVLASRR